MALLDKALRDEGFLLMRTPVKTGGDNPALIASRCALLDGGSFALDGAFQATVVQADGETRSARYVELPLGPTADAPTLGLIVTQLHHRNHHSGDPSRGRHAARGRIWLRRAAPDSAYCSPPTLARCGEASIRPRSGTF